MLTGLTERTIVRTFDGGTMGAVEVPITYVTTPDGLAWCVERVRGESAVGLDLETGGLNRRHQRIATLQVGNAFVKEPWIAVIDVRAFDIWQLRPLLDLLSDPARLKVVHNGKFEASWMRHHWGVWLEGLYDTQIAEQVIRAGLLSHPKALDAGADVMKSESSQTALTVGDKRKKTKTSKGGDDDGSKKALIPVSMGRMMARYGRINIEKWHDLRVSFDKTPVGEHTDRQLEYAAGDVVYPFMLRKQQLPLIRERGLSNILRVEMALIPVLADAEVSGMGFDSAAWLALADEAEREQAEVQTQLDQLAAPFSVQQDLFGGLGQRPINPFTNEPWNYDSPEQVKDFIGMYCDSVQWPVELVFTEPRVLELQKEYGKEWLDRTNQWIREKAAKTGRKPSLRSWAHVPLWVIPQDKHYLLLTTDHKNLTIGMVRNCLPRQLTELLVKYAKLSMRASTYGRKYLKHVENDTVYFEFNQNLAATGRLSASPNCYDSKTEILTERGWVPFPELVDGEKVAQFDKDRGGRVDFVIPSHVVHQRYVGDMIHLESDKLELLVTPNHRMLMQMRSGRWEVREATEFVGDRKHWHAGYFAGGTRALTPTQIRWLVALQADGHVRKDGYGLEFSFAKRRKIDRFKALCDELGIKYDLRDRPHHNKMRFWIWTRDVPAFAAVMLPHKTWGPWLLECSAEALDALIDELFLWDGCKRFNEYYSANRENHDWLQAVFALRGRRARVTRREDHGRVLYTLGTTTDHRAVPFSWTSNVRSTRTAYDGTVHCVTVPSGFVLVRRYCERDRTYKVSVSGNTMAWPRDSRYRACAKPRPGFKFCIADLSQIEPRLLAQVSGDFTYRETYAEGRDLYISIGEAVYGKPIDKHTPEGKLMRQSSKVMVLSLAYKMQWYKYWMQYTLAMADQILAGEATDLDPDGAKYNHGRFFEVCDSIKAWQDAATQRTDFDAPGANLLYDDLIGDTVVYNKAPCGRIRLWTRDQSPWNESCNFEIQGAGATGTKIACVLLARRIREQGWDARIVNIIHDEIVVEVEEAHAHACALALKECMEQAFAAFMPDVPVVAEFPEKAPTGVADCWQK